MTAPEPSRPDSAPHELVLGTAGHIDHGKTLLVKALTGIDCDRLPEEKARGMTIDIGFAHLQLGEYRLGVVDVPGHERFIRNMLAGATGIDLCLLVVAADDSVMPQTREHLDILCLLGLRQGVVALTKVDLVDGIVRELAAEEVRDLVRGTFLEDSAIVPVSAKTGAGLDELKSRILAACSSIARDRDASLFRMAIDRAFVVQGHGTVVTGSVSSGSARVGDEVQWWPSGETVRVRSLQNHGKTVDEVRRGMRAAVNLAGVRHDQVHRGQELAHPGYLRPSRALTVHVHALASLPRPLKRRTAVRVHVGGAEIMGSLALLDRDRLEPDQWGLAQVFLNEPYTAVWGQPFVIREASAKSTLGGGQILQPTPQTIRRRSEESIAHLRNLLSEQIDQRADAAAWFGVFAGIDVASLVRSVGVAPPDADDVADRLVRRGILVELSIGHARRLLLHADRMSQIELRILGVLQRAYEQNPYAATHERAPIEARLSRIGVGDFVRAVIDRLIADGKLEGDARRVGSGELRPRLTTAQARAKQAVVTAYREAGYRQALYARTLERQATVQPAVFQDLVRSLVDEGELVHLEDDLFLHVDALRVAERQIADKLRDGQGLRIAEVRDILQSSRTLVVPLCGYLDRMGVTRRDGDVRYLAK